MKPLVEASILPNAFEAEIFFVITLAALKPIMRSRRAPMSFPP